MATTLTRTAIFQTCRRNFRKPPVLHAVLPAPHTGTIHILALNEPKSRNAISTALLNHLANYLDTHFPLSPSSSSSSSSTPPSPATRPRALIISSSTPTASFCSGANLKERATFTPQQTAAFLTKLRNTFKHLEALPIPTITAISAPALGGGAELSLSTDFRVLGSTRGVLGFPETRLAILPGAGGTYRLKALVGESRALDLVLTGRKVGPAEALSLGLVSRVVDDGVEPPSSVTAVEGEGVLREQLGNGGAVDRTLLEAVGLAREICEGGPVAVEAAKRAVRWRGEEWERDRGENEAYLHVVDTKDKHEALRAFREKRRPVFRGE
ncbi:ClpP/crotonase-like domain-containing protein [Peziza echinospora]|nr:ClpP/crotonase-like domain-containing protein [Peziza echinospora]